MNHSRFALIVAGGSGLRMGSEIPKQFMPLLGYPVLMHTLRVFHQLKNPPQIHLVVPAVEIDRWESLCEQHSFIVPHKVVAGGETRFHSVKNGLQSFGKAPQGLVAIHDGVRPLISADLIEKCYTAALEKGNAIPAIRPTESVRLGTQSANNKEDRNSIWLIQTPQVFILEKIKQYYQNDWKAYYTDDASVAEDCGETINLVDGKIENIKITTPLDMIIANAIMERRLKETV
jgi:2-C-methyl-D-erythritol 4-phosphate cytidylyltransferase